MSTVNDEAGLLLNSTLVVPTKLSPLTITGVLVALRAGEKPEIRGATTKSALLAWVPDGLVTRMGPLRASTGTVATIRVSDETLKSAALVPNWTILAVEKPTPLMTTCVPGLPCVGEKPLMTGVAQACDPGRNN